MQEATIRKFRTVQRKRIRTSKEEAKVRKSHCFSGGGRTTPKNQLSGKNGTFIAHIQGKTEYLFPAFYPVKDYAAVIGQFKADPLTANANPEIPRHTSHPADVEVRKDVIRIRNFLKKLSLQYIFEKGSEFLTDPSEMSFYRNNLAFQADSFSFLYFFRAWLRSRGSSSSDSWIYFSSP